MNINQMCHIDGICEMTTIIKDNPTKDEKYDYFKAEIVKLNLSPEEYESAIRRLCIALEY